MKDLYILADYLKFCPENRSIGRKEDPYLWMCEIQRWLREVHKIDITIRSGMFNSQNKIYHYSLPYHETSTNWGKFETYELALEKALEEALKLIK